MTEFVHTQGYTVVHLPFTKETLPYLIEKSTATQERLKKHQKAGAKIILKKTRLDVVRIVGFFVYVVVFVDIPQFCARRGA